MKKPNILFFGIDSLRADHMSLYGYHRLTTPHIDNYLKDGAVFSRCFSPSVPTTPGYTSMLTGLDCFSTDVVALRHVGDMSKESKTLAEVLRDNGYETSCVGFGDGQASNVSARGFDNYLDFSGWGSYAEGRSHKAENLNAVAIPELKRLAEGEKPFMLFLRHMDPHSPYLPPAPYERMFYDGNEYDKTNKSLEPVYKFKPFCDYFVTWFPPGCTDKDYIIAQYDGEVAYMDACIQNILTTLKELGLEDDTLVVFTSDHGETLYDHECWFDHHGIYECTLTVPFALRFPGKIPNGFKSDIICQHKDIMPTILDIIGINSGLNFDGRSLVPLFKGQDVPQEPEMYITECTWQRKHGLRTPEWKLIVALEPDFHYKPGVELYNLIKDPQELHNLADEEPEVVKYLTQRMLAHIEKRTKEVGRENPMYTNVNYHGFDFGAFESSDQAYNTLHIGDVNAAKKLQAELEEKERD